MSALAEKLLSDPAKRARVLTACEKLVDDEVGSKGGLSGLAIKAAYKVVQGLKPGFVREALDALVEDFVKRLEPFYDGGSATAFAASLRQQPGKVADALLGITDERAKRAQNPNLRSAYDKLRPQAKKHVEEAVPRVAQTIASLL
jgi:hypothetical protein